jgi:hypothetical protein
MKLSELNPNEWVFDEPEKVSLLNKIRQNKIKLNDYCNKNIFAGIKTGFDSAFVIDKTTKDKLVSLNQNNKKVIRPWLKGKDVRKWHADFKDTYVIYIPLNKLEINDFPDIEKHLAKFKIKLEQRATAQKWFEMQQPQERFTELFNKPKIIYPDCAKEMRACYDTTGAYGTMAMYFLPYSPLVMGILNSKLFDWYARMTFATFGDPWKGGRIIFKSMYMKEAPIPKKDQNTIKIERIVDQILELMKNKTYDKLDEKEKRKIKEFEGQIDELVFKAFSLDNKEIKIITEMYQIKK